MEILTFKVTPLSPFVTYPKGDTLFGQIVAYSFLNGSNTFSSYLKEDPKMIVSDMMPYGYVYRPNLPMDCFKSTSKKEIDKKELRKRKFIKLEDLQVGNLHLCEKVEFIDEFLSIKNSINRMTFATDSNNSAPYGVEEIQFSRKLWMFVLVDKSIKEEVINLIKEVGRLGFGKNSNTGKGNFKVELIAANIQDIDSVYSMSISPTIMKDANIIRSWYEPFTRFGKFGLNEAHSNAFKKPILMADSGSVVRQINKKEFFGKALDNGFNDKPSFLQGYSISIPFVVKDEKCLDTK